MHCASLPADGASGKLRLLLLKYCTELDHMQPPMSDTSNATRASPHLEGGAQVEV